MFNMFAHRRRAAHAQGSPLQEGPATWAAARATFVVGDNGLQWRIALPEEHTTEVALERFPSCLAVSVLRRGTDVATAGPLDVLRRAIPLTEALRAVEPVATIVQGVLVIEFPRTDDEPDVDINELVDKWLAPGACRAGTGYPPHGRETMTQSGQSRERIHALVHS